MIMRTVEQLYCSDRELRNPSEKTAVAMLQKSRPTRQQIMEVVRVITRGPKQASGRSPSEHQQVSLRPEH